MAKKIIWEDPVETTVTTVEVSSSPTIYGSYTVGTTMDATSDGLAKSVSNTWVTSWTDASGARTTYYKVRMSDGTYWSDYSAPITPEEKVQLCTVADVGEIIDTIGRWSDTSIFNMIQQTDDLIYVESGTPVQQTWSNVGKIDSTVQNRYYTGEENIYRVDRLFYGTTTKTELFLDDGYKANNRYGMVEVLPVASSGVTLAITDEIEIHYVPEIYHKLSLYRTCQALLEQVDATSGGEQSKELQVMINKVKMVEQLLSYRIGVQISSDVSNYNSVYGVNRKKVIQNFDKNRYIGSTGW